MDTPDKKIWWEVKRSKYNIGLALSGITAFFSYAILGSFLLEGNNKEFEITIFTILFQGIAYLIMMLIANLFYGLGYSADKYFNTGNSSLFRNRLFKLGFRFSIFLPFIIPISCRNIFSRVRINKKERKNISLSSLYY